MREFATGATRDSLDNKPDYEGYLSPLVIRKFGEYMLKHQVTSDGERRESDNWQLGIPKDAYMKSTFRHFLDAWTSHRGLPCKEPIEESLCAILFNVSGYLHEILKGKVEEVRTPDGSQAFAALEKSGYTELRDLPLSVLSGRKEL